MSDPKVLIIDYGSQYTTIIERTIREKLRVRSIILASSKVSAWLDSAEPKGIILSGGQASITDSDAPKAPERIFQLKVPILGICLGLHDLVYRFGGSVKPIQAKARFGPVTVNCDVKHPLFRHLSSPSQKFWASHGDSVAELPKGFYPIAWGDNLYEAIWNDERAIGGIQCHPEVLHTSEGGQVFKAFVEDICRCQKDWNERNEIALIQNETLEAVGKDCADVGLSGGVDSTFLAAALVPVLTSRLFGVCVDGGQLREGELAEVSVNVGAAGLAYDVVNVASRMQAEFSGISCTDGMEIAEEKRKAFTRVYVEAKAAHAKRKSARVILQGSLRTDFIESAREGEAGFIKGHHNMYAEEMFAALGLKTIHPLRRYFKYEVRALAKLIGLPDYVVKRAPFPGPGLFIRWVGGIPTSENLSLLRWADHTTRTVLTKTGDYRKISQLVVAIPDIQVTGVKGDKRAYRYPVWIRGVESADFMTAQGYRFPVETQVLLERELPKHPQIVCPSYWPASKPPQTVEFE